MWQAVGALVVIAGILFSAGSVGYKVANGKWLPIYHTLANQMTKLQTDINLKNEEKKTEVANTKIEFVYVAKDSEIDYVKQNAEINRRVESYLNELAIAGLQPVGKEDSGGSGFSRPMSDSAGASFNRGGKNGLFADLDEFERATLKQIILKAERAVTLNILHEDYLNDVESEMVGLREKYKATQ